MNQITNYDIRKNLPIFVLIKYTLSSDNFQNTLCTKFWEKYGAVMKSFKHTNLKIFVYIFINQKFTFYVVIFSTVKNPNGFYHFNNLHISHKYKEIKTKSLEDNI